MAGAYGYVAYIDEAGDHALKLVANSARRGVSEWFVLAATVVSAGNEPLLGQWQRETIANFGYTQRRDIHFKDLNHQQRLTACRDLASRETRLFVVMSNKKNMQLYMNTRPKPDPDYFYKWMLRLLLERVTLFCKRYSKTAVGAPRTVKLVFSRNKWLDYNRFKEYLALLRGQSELGTMYLKTGDLQWDVIDLDHFEALDHRAAAGVQFADVVASAFYRAVAVDNREGVCAPIYAKLLEPRMYRASKGQILGFGLKTMPALHKMGLQAQQREVFESYGYPRTKW